MAFCFDIDIESTIGMSLLIVIIVCDTNVTDRINWKFERIEAVDDV